MRRNWAPFPAIRPEPPPRVTSGDVNAFLILDAFVPAASLARANRMPLPCPYDFPAELRRATYQGTSDGIVVSHSAQILFGGGVEKRIQPVEFTVRDPIVFVRVALPATK